MCLDSLLSSVVRLLNLSFFLASRWALVVVITGRVVFNVGFLDGRAILKTENMLSSES